MKAYAPEQSQDDFGKDNIIFSSTGVSHLSSQPPVNIHLPEERKLKSDFSSSMLWRVILPSSITKSRKECSEGLTFHSYSYFEINIGNFLKTNSLNHSWNCSTWAYSFLSLHFCHKYQAQKSVQASSLSSMSTVPYHRSCNCLMLGCWLLKTSLLIQKEQIYKFRIQGK